MRFWTMTAAALAALAPVGAPAAAAEADFDGFRACVAAVEDATVASSFHACTGALAAPCGAAATAAEAATCIRAVRDEVEAAITAEIDALVLASGDERAEIEWYLADGRASGTSSCAVMASQDRAAGVAVGQRAVNEAFCELIVSGDVFGLLLRLDRDA